jgi:hypothetical protein
VVIFYNFTTLVCLDQEKSGNPEMNRNVVMADIIISIAAIISRSVFHKRSAVELRGQGGVQKSADSSPMPTKKWLRNQLVF